MSPMTEIADKINNVSNRTALIVLIGVSSMVGTAVASGLTTYFTVTGAIKDFRTEYRYDRKLQSIRDSLQDKDIQEVKEIRIAKYP